MSGFLKASQMFVVVAGLMAFATPAASSKPITIDSMGEFSSELNVGLSQEVPLISWSSGTIDKGLVSISSEAAHLGITGAKLGPTIDECFYTPIPAETTATPEPMSMLLLGSGLLGAAAGIRYRRRKSLIKVNDF